MQIKFQRHHIAPLLLFVLLVGTMAGVYQFYFREQLALYAENREKRETLVQIVNRLENSFRGDQGVGVPEVMVAKTRNKVIPYADAVERRARFFNIEGMQEFTPVAEGDIARFHYQAEYPRVWNELQQKAREARCIFNPGIDFNVPTPDSLAGQQVTRQQVHNWLRRFSFGASMAQMMFDARARQVMEQRQMGGNEVAIGRKIETPLRIEPCEAGLIEAQCHDQRRVGEHGLSHRMPVRNVRAG